MIRTKRSKARREGEEGGHGAVTDAYVGGEFHGAVASEVVEGWFGPGILEPDEALINAVDTRELAKALGIPLRIANLKEGPVWDRALRDYNRGYRSAARKAAREIDS